MKIIKLTSVSFVNYISKHGYAHAVAARNTSANHTEALQKQPSKISKLPNSITVTSIENYCPISHISVVIKAGSRYENGQNAGIVHCLRNCAGLATKNFTNFGITRNIQYMGGNMMVSSTREHMVYTLQCIRDNIDTAINYFSEVVSHQAFKPWEINDFMPRINVDLALHQKQPEAVLMEALHKAAFRGGLSHSLLCPSFMVGKHDSEMLHKFVKEHFTTQRTVVVGLGIDHEHLGESVAKYFDLEGGAGVITGTSKYGGGEVRIEAEYPITYAAIVAEGAGMGATKEMLSFAVLQQILGTGCHVKYSGQSSKLSVAASKVTSEPFMVSSININYSDTGLFGVYIAGQPNDMQQLVKAVVTQMREMTKNVSDQDIKIAKEKLKAKLHLSQESLAEQMEEMALQAITNGQLNSIDEVEKSIDALTTSDVAAVASKVMKTKPAMAAVGPLYRTPHLDELI